MLPLLPALRGALSVLRAAGLKAEVDPDELTIDEGVGLWLQPRSRREMTLDGGGTLVVWVYVIAASTDTIRAIEVLDGALSTVLELLPLSETDDVVDLAAAIVLPASSTPLPAYRVAVDLNL